MTESYRNPWYEGDVETLKFYKTDVTPIEYRGFKIYQRSEGTYDYVKDGICLAQRCGFGKEVVDAFYDDKECFQAERMRETYKRMTEALK